MTRYVPHLHKVAGANWHHKRYIHVTAVHNSGTVSDSPRPPSSRDDRTSESVLPTVDQARAFCAVADSGSYSEAGRDLQKHRVAVNRLVGRFSDAVNQGVLVHASTAGHATLTPHGYEILGAARRFLAAADALQQRRAAVRFSAYPSIAQRVVARAPALLGDALPLDFVAVAARARHDGGRQLVADVAAGRLDLVVAPAGQTVPGISEVRAYRWSLRVVLPGQSFRSVPPKVSPAGLTQYRLVATPLRHRSRELLADAFQDDGVPLALAVESESQELLRDIALNSHRHAAVLPDDAFGAPNTQMGPQLATANAPVYGGTYSVYSRSDDTARDEASTDPRGQLITEVAQRVQAALAPESSE